MSNAPLCQDTVVFWGCWLSCAVTEFAWGILDGTPLLAGNSVRHGGSVSYVLYCTLKMSFGHRVRGFFARGMVWYCTIPYSDLPQKDYVLSSPDCIIYDDLCFMVGGGSSGLRCVHTALSLEDVMNLQEPDLFGDFSYSYVAVVLEIWRFPLYYYKLLEKWTGHHRQCVASGQVTQMSKDTFRFYL
jgi:hypothetical protein